MHLGRGSKGRGACNNRTIWKRQNLASERARGAIPLVKGAKQPPLRGSIRFEDKEVSDMSKISSYVMQEDALFGFSTVKETLMFAAELRLPASLSYEEKEQKVENVIELGIGRCYEHTHR